MSNDGQTAESCTFCGGTHTTPPELVGLPNAADFVSGLFNQAERDIRAAEDAQKDHDWAHKAFPSMPTSSASETAAQLDAELDKAFGDSEPNEGGPDLNHEELSLLNLALMLVASAHMAKLIEGIQNPFMKLVAQASNEERIRFTNDKMDELLRRNGVTPGDIDNTIELLSQVGIRITDVLGKTKIGVFIAPF